MSDEKQGQSSGKPNKFNQQNKHAEERKAGENERQNKPIETPTTDNAVKSEANAAKK